MGVMKDIAIEQEYNYNNEPTEEEAQRMVEDYIENQIDEDIINTKIKDMKKKEYYMDWLLENEELILDAYAKYIELGIDENDLAKKIWLKNITLKDVPEKFILEYFESWALEVMQEWRR